MGILLLAGARMVIACNGGDRIVESTTVETRAVSAAVDVVEHSVERGELVVSMLTVASDCSNKFVGLETPAVTVVVSIAIAIKNCR